MDIKKELKLKNCVICSINFAPKRALQKCCGYDCSLKYAKTVQEKAIDKMQRKSKQEGLDKLKTKSDWLKELQTIFNKFIRLRDIDKPCISCGVDNANVWHASHLYPTTKGVLRFNEDNVWKSCQKCNVFLHGNLIEYRKRLIDLIGYDRVNYLDEHKNDIFNISIDDIKTKIKYYNTLLKQK